MLHFDDIVNLTYTISRLVLGLMERIESAARMTFVNHFFLYFSATSHSQHTAGLNVSGSFLLGVIYAMPAVDTNKINQLQSGVAGKPLDRFQGLTPRAKLMLGVGFCGSFTTFSTFSVDVVTWLSEGRTTRALSYIATNNVCSIAAAGFGMMVMKKLLAKA